jgi:hypothetical protein
MNAEETQRLLELSREGEWAFPTSFSNSAIVGPGSDGWVGKDWIGAPQGSFVLVPGGITHDFQNRSTARAGVLVFSHPGGFEQHMPSVVEWFTNHPAGNPAS